uniref:Uncharacterized protein n=1 Tax=Ciona savignyi TaxID=51511 RepID=H2YVD5_CIOSA
MDSSIEVLLESRKAQLLAEMNLDSKQEAEPTETERPTDGAGVHGELPSEGYDAGAVEEVLAGLSEKRVQEATERESGSNGKRRQIKNLFPLSVTLDNRKKIHQQHDCIDIAKHRADPGNHRVNVCDPSNVNMGFYSDRSAAYRC